MTDGYKNTPVGKDDENVTLFSIGGIKIKINILLLFITLLWIITGYIWTALIVYLALILHESAHILAARGFKVKVYQLELLPFGSSAMMDDVFEQMPLEESLIAAAGPAASVITAALATTVRSYFPLFAPDVLEQFITYSFLIAGFNLLPVLPLDGGRIMRACLARTNDYGRATKITSALGILLGLGMTGWGVYTFVSDRADAMLPMLGIFLIISAIGELKQSRFELAKAMINRRHCQEGSQYMGVKVLAVKQEMQIYKAVRLFKDKNYYVIRVINDDMKLLGTLDETQIQNAMLKDMLAPIGSLIKKERSADAYSPKYRPQEKAADGILYEREGA